MRVLLLPALLAIGSLVSGCTDPAVPTRSADPSRAVPEGSAPRTIAYGAAASQFGELSLPAGAESMPPVVVLIHGGFWSASFGLDLMRPLANDLTSRGYAVWNIEYRRLGEDGGGYPGTLHDVAAAVDELAVVADDHALDVGRVALVGHSAGGHLALWAAGRPNQLVTAAVAIGQGPVVDLVAGARAGLGGGAVTALLGATPDDQPERYVAATPTTATETKLVVVRGSDDSVVPARFTLPAEGAGDIEVIDIAGDDHFDLIDPASSSWAAVISALAL
jgi:acetyl esterase/lipase